MSQAGPVKLTVVVPTRDRPQLLAGCLAALAPELHDDDELLVVDSCSRVAVPHAALRVDVPGASRARNAGWRAARGDVVAFLDDDVRVLPGWRAAVEPAVAGVDLACGRVQVPPSQQDYARPVALTPDLPETMLQLGRPVLGVSANLLVRRSVLTEHGGFDERLGPGTWFAAAEDVELLDRLLARGCTGRYAPSLLVEHEQWRDRRELLRLDWGYGKGAGARAIRAGGGYGRHLARLALWEQGLRPVGGDLCAGYRLGVATGVVRAAGTLAGLAVAAARR